MVWAQSEPSISDAINKLPTELQGKVDEKQVDELKNKSMQAFKKKCEDNGGPDAYPQSEVRILISPLLLLCTHCKCLLPLSPNISNTSNYFQNDLYRQTILNFKAFCVLRL